MREEAAKEALEALNSCTPSGLKTAGRKTLSGTKLQRRKTNVEMEFDDLLKHYGMPEHRQHFAAHAPSGALRQHILKTNPNRSCGADALGSTHMWRTIGSPHQKWRRRKDPILHRSPSYSFGRAPRVVSRTIAEDNEVRGVGYKGFWQKVGTPGPGAYLKSKNLEPFFFPAVNSPATTISLGANHPMSWKGPLGNSTNPVGCDFNSTMHSSGKFSFPQMRRTCSETGGGPNAVKTDEGCLSPGMEYHAYTTFGPGSPASGM